MMLQQAINRRHALERSAIGFGWLAALAMLDGTSAAAGAAAAAVPSYRIPARARRVIFMFMKGGPSQVDTFDYKPRLATDDGKDLPFEKPRVQFAATGKLLRSPWKFTPQGQCGMPVSELFPHVGRLVDDICFLHSVHGTNPAHGGALLKLHTGSDTFVRPSMGAWVNYGLGSENENLPGFITICPTLAHGGVNNWASAFLPAEYQGVPMGVAAQPSSNAHVKFITNPRWSKSVQRAQIDMIRELHGPGETVGAALVALPGIAGVVFTGSTQVARHINRALAAKDGPIVPLIAETGGLNAMVVDSTALPEQVVDAVVQSAFRSAGQRCSALRLLCLHEGIADRVIEMIQGAAKELVVGDTADIATEGE